MTAVAKAESYMLRGTTKPRYLSEERVKSYPVSHCEMTFLLDPALPLPQALKGIKEKEKERQ